MLRKLDTGLFVIELMGQGVNYVTGDYSRGASGFWVEGGRIVHPVQEITIAGHLQEMFAASSRSAPTPTAGHQDDRLDAGQSDEGRRQLIAAL